MPGKEVITNMGGAQQHGNGKLPQNILYAQNNQDPTPGSPILRFFMELTSLVRSPRYLAISLLQMKLYRPSAQCGSPSQQISFMCARNDGFHRLIPGQDRVPVHFPGQDRVLVHFPFPTVYISNLFLSPRLDFPGRSLLVIQKGHIKKTYAFDTFHHYDSEEGLHVALKFSDGDFEFEADNTEEKYTICRLLGSVLQAPPGGEDSESIDSGQGLSTSIDHDVVEVIKEGILEKKGHTAITTWNRRRVRLTPGEFSYFKPGEELALNIVQLWQENCEVKKQGTNIFTILVRDRAYSFRVPSEYKAMNMTETVRDEWFQCFERALRQVPSSAKIFDQGCQDDQAVAEPLYDVTPDMSSRASAHERMVLPHNKRSKGEITAHVTVHLNYIDQGPPPLPPREALGRRHSADTTLSTSSTGVSEGISDDDLHNDSVEDDDPFNMTAAAFRAKLAIKGGKSSSLKDWRSRQDLKKKKREGKWGMKAKTKGFSSPEAATLQIRPIATSSTKGQRWLATDKIFDTSQQTVSTKPASLSIDDSLATSVPTSQMASPTKLSTSPKKHSIEMPPPPLPPLLHSPGAPPGGPPPPPPLLKGGNMVKLNKTPNIKLKQVHWVKINNNQLSTSMWRDARDMTENLDLVELEEQFSIQEKKAFVIKQKPQEEKQMLMDTKRAQNLGILFSGIKIESLTKLTEALNSTIEVESFPADKMATLKRYQPTTEDIEMYRMYSDKRDSLHDVDRFMLALCEIPRLRIRLDLVGTLWDFPDQYISLEEEVNDLLSGCEEVLTNTQLTKILEYLLSIGNYMNANWNSKHGVSGFQLSSIEKVLNVKGRDPQTTLCTYLVRQLRRTDPALLDWPSGVSHVTKCAGYSVKAVGAEIDVLKNDLQKIKKTLKALRDHKQGADKMDKKFQTDVQNFIVEYDRKMVQLDSKYTKVTDKYKQMLLRFGEPQNKTAETLFAAVSLFADVFQQACEKTKSHVPFHAELYRAHQALEETA
ncbi:disheveled-associated activator of morphogenesis 2-like protein [Plakobranchus ocellatus]|uniref:Disheveled-associated activator of morphogenesis 2-like protein n=1 Tax=Plakobranchus ocellatus TaxID=259542 RepID=A0AAV3Y2G3_9GAST|nr:disheveled-associated activator of morphogenesis 2-like protein [Plakobranchus ocellatus]